MSGMAGGRGHRPRWPRLEGLAYGGDYNPEQWPQEVWQEDVRLMREASVNLVTVGVFAWSRLQPEPDRWDLGWLDQVLDLLHANGIAVDLATATASPPPWFSRRHPDSLPQAADGRRLSIGSRQHVCPSSAAFRSAALELVERLAERYAGHPAVVMWHVGNEYGDHVEACWCDASAAHFREWLRARHGSLDALNEAWSTSVWSQRYGDWEEILPPRDAPGPLNPGQCLDFRRFSSDALLECFLAERDVLRRRSPELPVTTNFMRLFDGLDHWRWAAEVDLVAVDLYPDPADPGAVTEAAFNHDLMRSLGEGRPWLVMEQAPGAVDWRPVNVPRPDGAARLASLQAVARGADGSLFFQWRSSGGGAERFHSTMLPWGGTGARGWPDTVRLGEDLARLAEVRGSRVTPAQVALLLDWESWWALELGGLPTSALDCRALVLAAYRSFHEAGVAVDVRHPGAELGPFRLAVAPSLHLVTAGTRANLEAYVRAGGVLVVGPFSGIVDAQARLWPGPHPGALKELLGIRVDEFRPLLPGGHARIAFRGDAACGGVTWSDRIVLAGAESLAYFSDGDLAGLPAITRHRVGAGEAWYLGTVLDAEGWSIVVTRALQAAGIGAPVPLPPGVELVRREGDGAGYLFVLNHGRDPARVPVGGDAATELLSGTPVAGMVTVAGLDVAVVRIPRGTG